MRALDDNPFFVLGLPLDCRPIDVEAQGRKLLGMLELGLSAARTYSTPLGERPRDAEKVRAAMAALRDPATRLGHELWAGTPMPATETAAPAVDEAPFPDAFALIGWRPR